MQANDNKNNSIPLDTLLALRAAAIHSLPVAGLTHRFYRYPARFSPVFVASAIEAFSKPGQIVLDPYMGGGTTIVEALARGRKTVGCDLNSLAVFVAKAKTTLLSEHDRALVSAWAYETVPSLSYHADADDVIDVICPHRTKNLTLPRARPAKKLIAQAMLALQGFKSNSANTFARCVLLNVAQWALNNRKVSPTLAQVRAKIMSAADEMLHGLDALVGTLAMGDLQQFSPTLCHGTAAELPNMEPFSSGSKADLVVTSPPYPGIHILYHRWQVDGRKETPAPYWIADCLDGRGASFYNFGDRKRDSQDDYFEQSLRTLRSVRSVMKEGALMVQMIAFSKPTSHLRKYLHNMALAGFEEVRETDDGRTVRKFRRVWRAVPGRKWYAQIKGSTSSSREVVLIHRAR